MAAIEKGTMSNHGIKFQITKRIEANQRRAAAVLQTDERERETLRELNRQAAQPITGKETQ
jgi:hypothetical protein